MSIVWCICVVTLATQVVPQVLLVVDVKIELVFHYDLCFNIFIIIFIIITGLLGFTGFFVIELFVDDLLFEFREVTELVHNLRVVVDFIIDGLLYSGI